ncbi:hypothetical protein QAD02_000347 [Eretmocerus hayati]|uniref:Uncharacterized protein n=1 Tax=Eretmocerus hayati TaxID=131215 RepID=A0ACC2NDS0_9HYME|nr:hypothetical protein QAD02_000347 [Eretmocerus hayati]
MGGVQSGAHALGDALWVQERQKQKGYRIEPRISNEISDATATGVLTRYEHYAKCYRKQYINWMSIPESAFDGNWLNRSGDGLPDVTNAREASNVCVSSPDQHSEGSNVHLSYTLIVFVLMIIGNNDGRTVKAAAMMAIIVIDITSLMGEFLRTSIHGSDSLIGS